MATCQFGLMFFPDPIAGLVEMRRVAGRGTVAVWDSIDRSAGYLALQELFRSELGAEAAASLDAPFTMGGDGSLEALLEAAEVHDATLSSIAGSAKFADIAEWVTTEVRGWTLGDSVSDDELAAVIAAAETRFASFSDADGCFVPMAAKVAVWS